jgi:hypothetical protein
MLFRGVWYPAGHCSAEYETPQNKCMLYIFLCSAWYQTPQNNFEIRISPRIRTGFQKCFRVWFRGPYGVDAWILYALGSVVYTCSWFSKSVPLQRRASSQNFYVWFRGVLICQRSVIPRRTRPWGVSDPAELSLAGYQTPQNNGRVVYIL